MMNHYDIAYGLGVAASAPYWLINRKARRKVKGAFSNRMGTQPVVGTRDLTKPAVLIHAVSVGEINATRTLVQRLQDARPDVQCIISVTTDSGFDQARQLYSGNTRVILIRYPLDFTSAVRRTLESLKPDLVVLMELELWPNFLRECQRRHILVVLINGRLTSYSHRNYAMIKPIVSRMLKRLSRICVQDQAYAEKFIDLGAPPERVGVTGTMKFDTAQITHRVDGDESLATAVGLWPGAEPIWVCGSTGPGEEEIVLRVYRALLTKHSRLRLVIIPRKPERFDEVARLIRQMRFDLTRRSSPNVTPGSTGLPAVVLGDTMGELRRFYSLSSIVFVGRTLVDLGPRQHGSDMIEPAALGRPVVLGPFTTNFADAMKHFRAAAAMMEVSDEATLGEAMNLLLLNGTQAASMARRAQQVVIQQQGATARHATLILSGLPPRHPGQGGQSVKAK